MKATFSATVFHVSDVERSLKFYIETLGFDEAFRVGDYAGVCAGEVMIHLCGPDNDGYKKPIGAGHLCIMIEDADSYYQVLQQKNVTIIYPIGDRFYGIRDFSIADEDGNILVFGHELKEIC